MHSLLDPQHWPYAWYGYWHEYGPDFAAYPSAHSFVDPSRTARYDLPRLLAYLRSGQPLWATSRANFPSPFTGQPARGSLSYVTDGTRCWLDDVADYVEGHALAIPDAWYAQIEANGFRMPVLTEEQLAQMRERPPLL
jgi:hypothetical protein